MSAQPAPGPGLTVTLRARIDERPTAEVWRAVVETAESLRELAADVLPKSWTEVAVTASEAPQATGLVVDPESLEILVDGSVVVLTRRERDLLLFLAGRPRAVVTRETLLRSVWGWHHVDAAGTRTVDVHVRRLRVKLGGHAGRLVTVRGIGYRFEAGRRETVVRPGGRWDVPTDADGRSDHRDPWTGTGPPAAR